MLFYGQVTGQSLALCRKCDRVYEGVRDLSFRRNPVSEEWN